MIVIRKPYAKCTCTSCPSDEDVRLITFKEGRINEGRATNSITVVLCKDCRRRLFSELKEMDGNERTTWAVCRKCGKRMEPTTVWTCPNCGEREGIGE